MLANEARALLIHFQYELGSLEFGFQRAAYIPDIFLVIDYYVIDISQSL